jgi:predicted alternative tryptophan synthase beta-subunit
MVKISYQQKPYRKSLMHLWGADVIPSPSKLTNSGKKILEKTPDSPVKSLMSIPLILRTTMILDVYLI